MTLGDKKNNMNAYKIFSKFYDQYIKETAPLLHQKYFNLVLEIINKFKLNTTSILDASCGTGILAKMFLDAKYDIEGADISEDMLECANQKGIKTYNKDICNLDLDRKYDIILCFDSFGHVLGKDNIKKALYSISKCLKYNGVLICDGGTRKKAQNMIGQIYNYDSKDYKFTWLNTKQDDYVNVHFKIYDKKSENYYEENFCLEGHDIEDIITAASTTDLKVIIATLEPVVKLNRSFIMCLRKEVEENRTQPVA